MKWLKAIQILLMLTGAAYVFLPVVHDNFPYLIFILLPLIFVFGPISARLALKEFKRKEQEDRSKMKE